MKQLIRHRWQQAICGPLPTLLLVVCAAGCALAVMSDPAGQPHQAGWIVFVAAFGLSCLTMALASHRRTDRRNAEMMADAKEENSLLASRLIGEFDAHMVAADFGLDGGQPTYSAAGQDAARREERSTPMYYDYVYGAKRQFADPENGELAPVLPMARPGTRKAS